MKNFHDFRLSFHGSSKIVVGIRLNAINVSQILYVYEVQTLRRDLQNKRIGWQTIWDGEQTDWDVVYNMGCNSTGI